MNEVRVGYMSIDVLADMVKEYIDVYTVDKRYVGEICFLDVYRKMVEYLK
jgi:hypothetical protein